MKGLLEWGLCDCEHNFKVDKREQFAENIRENDTDFIDILLWYELFVDFHCKSA